MGYVPNHGPHCYKVDAYPIRCDRCHERVIYFECSCGSKVFLDPGGDGIPHRCIDKRRGMRASILLEKISVAAQKPEGQTVCPMCQVEIKNSRARLHFKRCPKRKDWVSFED